MSAASVNDWRPLGQVLVERGLISQDELEQALAEQRETGGRLGEILVSRGWVSGPELAATVSEQLGIELETESGFGAGLFAEIRRRHAAGRGLTAVPEPEPEPAEPEAGLRLVEYAEPLSPEQELDELRAQVAVLEQALERERTARVEAEHKLAAKRTRKPR